MNANQTDYTVEEFYIVKSLRDDYEAQEKGDDNPWSDACEGGGEAEFIEHIAIPVARCFLAWVAKNARPVEGPGVLGYAFEDGFAKAYVAAFDRKRMPATHGAFIKLAEQFNCLEITCAPTVDELAEALRDASKTRPLATKALRVLKRYDNARKERGE